MTYEDEKNKAIDLDTAVAMMKAAKGIVPDPIFDETTGRYTNDSIVEWMDARADGLIYGVQIPKYDYSPTTEAIKTDANVGLVLEPSTNDVAGRNDYEGRKLFMCPRVNGGVDTDGMPYITAIEGIDETFSPREENTWALTPVYYAKYTETDEYYLQQYTDTPRSGFTACTGAHTADGVPRPYILRACYADSDGTCTTKSGTAPATAIVNTKEAFNGSRNRSDGLTFLSYADITYRAEFMQLMLGVKAQRDAATGCTDYNVSAKTTLASTGSALVSGSDALKFKVGLCVHVGSSSATLGSTDYNIARCARITAMENAGGNVRLVLDVDPELSIPSGSGLTSCPARSGTCDAVKGTFGTCDEDGLTDGKSPFLFQNIECLVGVFESPCNIYANGTGAYVAADISACSGLNTGAGWSLAGALPSAGYVKDVVHRMGARLPLSTGASSTTGARSYLWNTNSGARSWWTGGSYYNMSAYGSPETVNCNNAVTSTGLWYNGSRASAIGHSILEEATDE